MKIDLITIRPDGAYVLVLVEEGRWAADAVASKLRELQTRLYDAVDVAIDGHLASKYPESKGQTVIIRLDCYDVPREPVEEFFLRFSESIKARDEVRDQIQKAGFVTRIDFEFNWRRSPEG